MIADIRGLIISQNYFIKVQKRLNFSEIWIMLIGYTYGYRPSNEPHFSVYLLDEEYKFVFFKPDGSEKSSFRIHSKTVENLNTSTGFEGYKHRAIECFRSIQKERWPKRFR